MIIMTLVQELKDGRKKVAIWGIGYIGYSTMAHFAREGVYCVGHDVMPHRVDDVNAGREAIPNMDSWLGFDVRPLVKNGLMSATLNWKDLISNEFPIHMISIPTEKDGKPYDNNLIDVLEKISTISKIKIDRPPLIIIESTLTPNRLNKLIIPMIEETGVKIGKDILLGVAPRRDWFTDAGKTLKTIPRVVGGSTPETTELMIDVLSIICDKLIRAKDHNHAEIVKSIENAYRHMDIALANQLSEAYPHLDMIEILKLVGTKWNVQTYHPSMGTGGYCIPLAPQYVLEGAKHPDKLTLLKESLNYDLQQPQRVVDCLINKGVKKVGILGITYTGDIKVHILSPSLKIIDGLKKAGVDVSVNDPYYTDEEAEKVTGCETFKMLDDLDKFDAIVIVSGHIVYKFNKHKIKEKLKNCKIILDNVGIWNDVQFQGPEYYEAGNCGWLGHR